MIYEQRPVVVEVTTRHVVWVDGDTQDDALRNANQYPWYELVNDGETDVSTWAEVLSPSRSDWDEVYGYGFGGGYPNRDCEAHIESYRHEQFRLRREAAKAACTAAGHPETESPLSDGRRWCQGCTEYLPAPIEVSP